MKSSKFCGETLGKRYILLKLNKPSRCHNPPKDMDFSQLTAYSRDPISHVVNFRFHFRHECLLVVTLRPFPLTFFLFCRTSLSFSFVFLVLTTGLCALKVARFGLSSLKSRAVSRLYRSCFSRVTQEFGDLLPARENWYEPPFKKRDCSTIVTLLLCREAPVCIL